VLLLFVFILFSCSFLFGCFNCVLTFVYLFCVSVVLCVHCVIWFCFVQFVFTLFYFVSSCTFIYKKKYHLHFICLHFNFIALHFHTISSVPISPTYLHLYPLCLKTHNQPLFTSSQPYNSTSTITWLHCNSTFKLHTLKYSTSHCLTPHLILLSHSVIISPFLLFNPLATFDKQPPIQSQQTFTTLSPTLHHLSSPSTLHNIQTPSYCIFSPHCHRLHSLPKHYLPNIPTAFI